MGTTGPNLAGEVSAESRSHPGHVISPRAEYLLQQVGCSQPTRDDMSGWVLSHIALLPWSRVRTARIVVSSHAVMTPFRYPPVETN